MRFCTRARASKLRGLRGGETLLSLFHNRIIVRTPNWDMFVGISLKSIYHVSSILTLCSPFLSVSAVQLHFGGKQMPYTDGHNGFLLLKCGEEFTTIYIWFFYITDTFIFICLSLDLEMFLNFRFTYQVKSEGVKLVLEPLASGRVHIGLIPN